jgi:hypothetical protein
MIQFLIDSHDSSHDGGCQVPGWNDVPEPFGSDDLQNLAPQIKIQKRKIK